MKEAFLIAEQLINNFSKKFVRFHGIISEDKAVISHEKGSNIDRFTITPDKVIVEVIRKGNKLNKWEINIQEKTIIGDLTKLPGWAQILKRFVK